MNPVLELLVEFFQDAMGLTYGLEFRSIHRINFFVFVRPLEQEQISVFWKKKTIFYCKACYFLLVIICHI